MTWLSNLLGIPPTGFMMPTQGNIILPILGHILCIIIAYLLGSINFAILISKFKFRDDIRTHGSGNAGMTNMLRTYGKVPALMTFLGDAFKAFIAVFIGIILLGEDGAYLAGLGVIVGHVYPIFFKLKGGKGVVTAIVTILIVQPLVALMVIAIFALVVLTTRYMSLGSILGAAFYPMLVYTFVPGAGFKVIYAFVIAVFIIWLHRANIMRLKDGTENKVGRKGKK